MAHLHGPEIILLLLLLVAVFSLLAEKIQWSAPIVMTLAGLGLTIIPGLPVITLDPHLVFLFILPPLLYVAGSRTSWRDFRFHLRSITLLATGLVVATTMAIAWAAMQLIPGLTWPVAILLGAIIAPPDAVAATALAEKLKLPKRIVTILEGESLMNDATSLVIYKIAIAVILSGSFTWAQVVGDFALMAVGGIGIGLAMGYVMAKLRKPIDNPPIEITLSLLTPFAAYLAAEKIGLSGILSVVACGLYIGWHLPRITSSNSRTLGYAVWSVINFLLNNMVFLLIGLQLPGMLPVVSEYGWQELAIYSGGIIAIMVLVRMAWVFPGAYLPHLLSRRVHARETLPPPNWVAFVGWAGMRGVVSLAAALALPLTMMDGTVFPYRDLIVFLTFVVIIFTLIAQGLTLAWVAKLLRIPREEHNHHEERLAREHSLTTALQHLAAHEKSGAHHPTVIEALSGNLKLRLAELGVENVSDDELSACVGNFQNLHRKIIHAQRQAILDLRHQHRIGDEIMRQLIRELDFEELRLQNPAS